MELGIWVAIVAGVFTIVNTSLGFLIKSTVTRIGDLEHSQEITSTKVAVMDNTVQALRNQHDRHASSMNDVYAKVNSINESIATLNANVSQMNSTLSQFIQGQINKHG